MGDGVSQPSSVLALYDEALRKRGFVEDPSQRLAVARLQHLFEEWSAYKQRRRTARIGDHIYYK